MKRMLPVTELARDSRFQRVTLETTVFDPRNLSPSAQINGIAPTYVNASDNARGLMHGIFVGEIQALEGAGRTCFDFETGPGRLADMRDGGPTEAQEGLGEEGQSVERVRDGLA